MGENLWVEFTRGEVKEVHEVEEVKELDALEGSMVDSLRHENKSAWLRQPWRAHSGPQRIVKNCITERSLVSVEVVVK
jgi:hypothetical protein